MLGIALGLSVCQAKTEYDHLTLPSVDLGPHWQRWSHRLTEDNLAMLVGPSGCRPSVRQKNLLDLVQAL